MVGVDTVVGSGFIILGFYWAEMDSTVSDLLGCLTPQFVLLNYFRYDVSKHDYVRNFSLEAFPHNNHQLWAPGWLSR